MFHRISLYVSGINLLCQLMQHVPFSLLSWNGQKVKNPKEDLREVATHSVSDEGTDILFL